MTVDEAIKFLDTEWEQGGFLGQVREGIFDPAAAQRFEHELSTLAVGESDMISRDLVRLLWFIPLFLEWQQERVIEQGTQTGDFENFTARVTNKMYELLGVP